jgi:hypothetical protein
MSRRFDDMRKPGVPAAASGRGAGGRPEALGREAVSRLFVFRPNPPFRRYNKVGSLAVASERRSISMLDALRHRKHHFSGLVHDTIESAFLSSGAILMLLALLVIWIGLVSISR